MTVVCGPPGPTNVHHSTRTPCAMASCLHKAGSQSWCLEALALLAAACAVIPSRANLADAVWPLVQVAQARSQAEQAEAAARASAAQARTAEDMVVAERKRLSQLYGSGLDDLPPQMLAVLTDVHRTGLQRIQSLQVEHVSTPGHD